MRRAFTLIELMVAVGLLGIVLSFSGVIFKVSIESHRMARANAEIMQKLRAITDQLNADFGGIRTDAPLLIWFKGLDDDPNRYDQIMFFADGDFQSIQLYADVNSNAVPDPNDGEKVVSGDAARVHYGQAQLYEGGDYIDPYDDDMDEESRLLARRQHILSADTELYPWPDDDLGNFDKTGKNNLPVNEIYEHEHLSLADWKTVADNIYDNKVIPTCFVFRPVICMDDAGTFHNLMCEGVGTFAIQWAYWDDGDEKFYWFPSADPDGDGSVADSHFGSMADYDFGVYFNIPGSITYSDWHSISEAESQAGEDFFPFPKALKFTFRLYDSRGLIKEDGRKGRVFTHIVYLTN